MQDFANYFHQSPDQLGRQHLRQYQAYLFQERKLDPGTVRQHVAALRFFYLKTLKRRYLLEDLPRPKQPRKLPEILSPEEVARLIDSASNLFHRTMLMTLYSIARHSRNQNTSVKLSAISRWQSALAISPIVRAS